MMAELILETGLSERQLLEDCGPDTVAALVQAINDRRTEGHSPKAQAMLERLRGAV